MVRDILLSFVPIFVAVDVIGVLPIFVSLTLDLTTKEKRKIILQSLVTATALSVGFIFLGRAIFRFLSITINDFMIAGGIILFLLAVIDLLSSEKERRRPSIDLGVVPIGTPLIAGPAVLTTSLLVIDQYGIVPTAISLFLNIVIAGGVFLASGRLIRVLGQAGTKALSKITSLFLAAIAVMMIRRGIEGLLF